MSASAACPLCGDRCPRVYQLAAAVHRCAHCRLDFAPDVAFDFSRSGRIDEAKRRESLRPLRMANFAKILDHLLPRVDAALPGLEVGSGYGWFQEAARLRGLEVLGVEPDAEVARFARDADFEVIDGFFSKDLLRGREGRYGFVAFNDVLEHLPDLPDVLATCSMALADDGVLVVNLPLRGGIFYRLAAVLHRLGMHGPLTRLWQFGFASPHLVYFSRDGVRRLLASHGFTLVDYVPLETIRADGLETRIGFDREADPGTRALARAMRSALPILNRCPEDIGCFFATKTRV